jgi:hypothetical protein
VGNLCISDTCAPGCHSGRDCPATKKICDPSGGPNGACVECVTQADCPAGDACFAGSCARSCNVESDCPGQHCDTAKHVCVACVSSDQCPIGNLCANDACVPGCMSDRDCPASAPHCDGAVQPRGACVQCLTPNDCPAGVACVGGVCGGTPPPPGDGGCDTRVHGFVYDPAKHRPIYNAIVYVPGGALTPIAPGVSCDRCGAPPDGNPVAVTLSKADGSFVLDNVPAGTNVPIVVQVGKWRRENARIAVVPACADTAVDAELTRLPKMQSEGHIPLIAISTGLDTMECALQTMGIDTSEFTASSGTGRVHMYQGTSGATAPSGTTAASSTLWANAPLLSTYDMVIDSCQGAAPTDKPQTSLDNIAAYVGQGGRLYLSHYENFVLWPTGATSQWSGTATQDPSMAGTGAATGVTADQAFPKGAAFAQWAVAVSDSTSLGSLSSVTNARADVTAVAATSKAWMNGLVTGATASHVLQYSFYSGASSCGKVAYSDFHVSAGAATTTAFPAECASAGPDAVATDLFEFFFLDALSCAQDDSQAPQVPPL